MRKGRLPAKRPPLFLKNLYLRHFRNYEEAAVSFSPGLNAIRGDNAQGKTNLLEAISLVSTGRSFRTQHLSELIQEGRSFFYLEAEIVRDGVPQTIKISFDGLNKRLQLNANSFATFHPLLGTLPSVLSAPEDIDLIAGPPAQRRRFLNLHLAQSDPLYVHHLSRFWRAMKQRNCLLRSTTPNDAASFGGPLRSPEAIECWEIEMALSASYLAQGRQELIEELKEPLSSESRRLSSEAEAIELRFHLTYSPPTYQRQLQKMRAREKDLGLTLNGPHRDDLSFWIASKPAPIFASEGQKKTAVSALRLAEWQRLAKRIGAPPLMAIDDFGGALDGSRQALLRDFLQSMGQVFLTTPHSFEAGHTLLVEKGRITMGRSV